ncbi:hypothetical protein [Flavobacterium sp.]|uniref:hypothetical protein n=1 Tax=Flavobacterium sp. TaxID=239 RepID=UPI00286E55DB|nr:hypothetical protein [Flavobacterium sp.]
MRILKEGLDFYINTSIHVAIAVYALVQITKLSLNVSTNLNLDYFIFFGTIVGYNFLKYFEIFWVRVLNFKNSYSIFLVSLIAIFGMIYYFFKLELDFKVSFLKIGFVVLWYPFLRKYGLLKMFVVAFCVTYISLYIPLSHYGFKGNDIFVFLLQRFLIVICLLVPLEIVDVEKDAKTIITLPQKIGIQNTKFLGYFLLILLLVIDFFVLKFYIEVVVAIVISIFIFFSNEKRSKYYVSFWVESIPVFWWFLLLIFS